jgi:hypothetical protein
MAGSGLPVPPYHAVVADAAADGSAGEYCVERHQPPRAVAVQEDQRAQEQGSHEDRYVRTEDDGSGVSHDDSFRECDAHDA